MLQHTVFEKSILHNETKYGRDKETVKKKTREKRLSVFG